MVGMLYLGIGILILLVAILLYNLAPTLGYYYLSIGLFIFSAYMIGKGLFMVYLYYSRFKFYKKLDSFNIDQIKEEQSYINFRSKKKNKNRVRYMIIIALGMIISFMGIFHQEKGLIVATCIPIVLISGIEFGVGLLTEFRLYELNRQIIKYLGKE